MTVVADLAELGDIAAAAAVEQMLDRPRIPRDN